MEVGDDHLDAISESLLGCLGRERVRIDLDGALQALSNLLIIRGDEREILIEQVKHFSAIHQHSPWPSSRVGK